MDGSNQANEPGRIKRHRQEVQKKWIQLKRRQHAENRRERIDFIEANGGPIVCQLIKDRLDRKDIAAKDIVGVADEVYAMNDMTRDNNVDSTSIMYEYVLDQILECFLVHMNECILRRCTLLLCLRKMRICRDVRVLLLKRFMDTEELEQRAIDTIDFCGRHFRFHLLPADRQWMSRKEVAQIVDRIKGWIQIDATRKLLG